MSHPALTAQIALIEKFLGELDVLISHPRIVQVEKEIEVEKEKKVPVLVPKIDLSAHRHQITLSLIIHKLMAELLSIKEKNPSINFGLDKDILKIFATDFKYRELFEGKDFNIDGQLNILYNHYDDLLRSIGGSNLTADQQLIYSSALQQKLLMGGVIREANIEIDKVKKVSEERNEAFKQMKQGYLNLIGKFNDLQNASQTGNIAMISQLVLGIQGLIENQGNMSIFGIPEKLLEDVFIHQTHESFVRLDGNFR